MKEAEEESSGGEDDDEDENIEVSAGEIVKYRVRGGCLRIIKCQYRVIIQPLNLESNHVNRKGAGNLSYPQTLIPNKHCLNFQRESLFNLSIGVLIVHKNKVLLGCGGLT